MHVKEFLSLWLMLVELSNPKQIPKVGPYSFLFKEISQCSEEDKGTDEIQFSEASMRRISRFSHEIAGRVTSNITIDDSLYIHLNNAIWGNGGWKRNSLTYNHGPACTVVKTMYTDSMEDILPQLVEQLNVTDCPIPAPFSAYFKMTMNEERFLKVTKHIPRLPYGKYKAELQFVKDGIIRGCGACIMELVPRRETGRS